MPSVGSVGSQAGAGSVGGSGIPASIQNMTSSYITITSHIFAAVDLWEQAEVLTRKNKGKRLCVVISGAWWESCCV